MRCPCCWSKLTELSHRRKCPRCKWDSAIDGGADPVMHVETMDEMPAPEPAPRWHLSPGLRWTALVAGACVALVAHCATTHVGWWTMTDLRAFDGDGVRLNMRTGIGR